MSEAECYEWRPRQTGRSTACYEKEIAALRAQRDDLLAALEAVVPALPDIECERCGGEGRVAVSVELGGYEDCDECCGHRYVCSDEAVAASAAIARARGAK